MVKTDVKRDYYADLELKSGADTEEIKKQFRKLALKFHPDRNPGREVEFNSKFQAIQAANEILTDPQQRAKYDADRLKSGYGTIYASPMRPPPPPRQTTTKFPPPPRPPPPPTSKSAYPKTTAAPKPNPPPFGAHRYTKFAKSESEAKQARAAAEQWEKAKEDAETKAGAFRGWEQMKSNVNTQNFRAPPKPKPPEYAGYARGAANAVPSNEPPRHQRSWEQFPGPQAPTPGIARTQSTRKKQGFAPATPGGDEPMARNTSAYFNVSRGDRPHASMHQSYFETPTSGQAPTARKRDPPSPLRHVRSHGGAGDPLSGLGAERSNGRYAQAGAGEKTYFASAGLGRSTSVRDPSNQQTSAASTPNGPKPHNGSGRHRSASPRLRRSTSSSSSSSESTDDDNWAARPKTATHRMSRESNNSDTRTRPAVKDFGEAKTFFDGSGRYGPKNWQQETDASQTYNTSSPTQSGANGFNSQHQRPGAPYPPPPPYPPPRDRPAEQRPLEKSRSWHDPDSPTRTRQDGTAWEPTSTQSQTAPNTYGFSSHFPYSLSTPSFAKWSDNWPFSSQKMTGASTPSPPYWAYPSSVMPPGSTLGRSSGPVSPSKRKASSSQQPASLHHPLGHSFSFLFDTNRPPGITPSTHPTNEHGPFRFQVPKGGSGFGRSPPPEFKSYSSENLNTAFNSAAWDGTFNGNNEYFAPKPDEGKRASRVTSSPTRGRPSRRSGVQSPTKSWGPEEDSSAADEARKPTAGAQSSFAPFSPAKFSAEAWAEKLKFSSSVDPSSSSTQAPGVATSRSRTPRRPSRSSVKRSSMPKFATVSGDVENQQGPAEHYTPAPKDDLDGGPMDIDPKETPPSNPAFPTSNGTDQSPVKEARPVYVEPQRPEWRANATETTPSANAKRSSRLSSQAKAAGATSAPTPQSTRLNLNNLNNVAPLAPSNDGLAGVSDLKTNLPFDSQASPSIPRPKAKPIVTPNPPKGPVPPKSLNGGSFEKYIAKMGAYMYEWNKYNRTMVQHFASRQLDIETNLSSTWMSSVGDGSVGDGKKGYADYMQALEEDSKVRTYWDISWEKHQETMNGLGRTREKMKALKNLEGSASAANVYATS